MSYKVKLSRHAAKTYEKLDPSIRPVLRDALDALQHKPLAGPKIKRLKGRLRQHLRYRAGDYRIIYTVLAKELIVYVDYLQHRKDVYRDFD